MLNDMTCIPTLIEAGHSIRIEDGRGTEVSSLEGTIWITQTGDPRDIVLSPGQSFTLDRNGLTLLVALIEPAVTRIVEAGDRSALAGLAAAGVVGSKACECEDDERSQALAA